MTHIRRMLFTCQFKTYPPKLELILKMHLTPDGKDLNLINSAYNNK